MAHSHSDQSLSRARNCTCYAAILRCSTWGRGNVANRLLPRSQERRRNHLRCWPRSAFARCAWWLAICPYNNHYLDVSSLENFERYLRDTIPVVENIPYCDLVETTRLQREEPENDLGGWREALNMQADYVIGHMEFNQRADKLWLEESNHANKVLSAKEHEKTVKEALKYASLKNRDATVQETVRGFTVELPSPSGVLAALMEKSAEMNAQCAALMQK